MPRVQKSQKPRRDPLLAQLNDDELYEKYGRVTQPGKRTKSRSTPREDDKDEVDIDHLGHNAKTFNPCPLGDPRS
jgi:essential nuclear protein 1